MGRLEAQAPQLRRASIEIRPLETAGRREQRDAIA
jgi:hypothetical protein